MANVIPKREQIPEKDTWDLSGLFESDEKWFEEYGFELEIVLEACNRTITNTHKPDFKYTDSILKNWLKHGVKSLADITQLDLTFLQQKANSKKAIEKTPAKTRFNNFEGRTYDMKSLEQQLLNINR